LDWIRVVVTLVDDRRVSEEHEASNARMVRRHLLQHRAAQARLMSLAGHGQIGSADDWTSRVARADRQLLDLGPADVTVLGMGLDGHFASLFPHAVELPQALDPRQEHACLSVHLRHPPPEAPFDRISQTLAHIVRSRLCVLPLTGADKLGVLKQALNHGDPQWPVSALLHSPGFSEASPLLLWITP
jgi:6-phosphogluconolactonase